MTADTNQRKRCGFSLIRIQLILKFRCYRFPFDTSDRQARAHIIRALDTNRSAARVNSEGFKCLVRLGQVHKS